MTVNCPRRCTVSRRDGGCVFKVFVRNLAGRNTFRFSFIL